MSSAKVIIKAVSLTAFHLKGIEMLIKKKKDKGILENRSALTREALADLFAKYEMTPDDIRAEMEE